MNHFSVAIKNKHYFLRVVFKSDENAVRRILNRTFSSWKHRRFRPLVHRRIRVNKIKKNTLSAWYFLILLHFYISQSRIPNSPMENTKAVERIEEVDFSNTFPGLNISSSWENSFNNLDLFCFLHTGITIINQCWNPNPQRRDCIQNVKIFILI